MISRLMKKNILAAVFVFFMTTFMSEISSAQCGLSINANNLNVTWDMLWTIQSVSITVSKTNPAACTFGLGFSKGGAGSYTRYANNAGQQLFYQLYNDGGAAHILKDVPDPLTTNDVVMVTLPAGSGPQIVQYFFDIPYTLATTPLLVAAGTYTDSFTISAYEGADPTLYTAPAAASAPVNLTVVVDKQINLSFTDLGGIYQDNTTSKTINFGTLSTGQVSRFNMAVRTNAGFTITVTSTNTGRFKHATQNSYVPYTMFVNNVLTDMTGAVPVAVGSGQSSMSGLIFPIRLVVGTVNALSLSGTYSDVITVTAIATD